MTVLRPTVQHGLTAEQAALVERHERGLRRLADTLAKKNGMRSTDIMFVLADRKSRIGRGLSTSLPVASIGPVVLPGRGFELEAWIECLAMHSPVWEVIGRSTGIPVVVVDEHGTMAVVRLVEQPL